jgi:chromosomal replication initiator protein
LADARIESARAADEDAKPKLAPLTFDSFCVDSSNHRAFTVAQMIGAGAGHAFPQWLVHSQPGCGKTHLLTAIAHTAMSQGRTVLMLTGQEFLEHFQAALHKKRDAQSFKDMVRAPDLLIIDDFHRICGKKATEEEAFDTFYDLTRRSGQVVIAANHGAEGLEGLSDVLRARLKGWASCEITEPDAALRRRILEMRVAHYMRQSPGFSVAPEALDMIAERMHVTGRELDGAVCQLLIEWKISGGTTVTLEAAANALQAKLSDAAERRITVQLVQKVVARHYGMTPQQLLERTRRHAIARPRQVAMFLACRMTHASLPDIGQRFGGFDHTTIMYARDRIAALAEQDANLKAELEGIARAIRREP